MAVQALVEAGKAYFQRDGSLFFEFVNIKKALDRIKYCEIWGKLSRLKIGKNVIRMVMKQHQKQSKRVAWGDEIS